MVGQESISAKEVSCRFVLRSHDVGFWRPFARSRSSEGTDWDIRATLHVCALIDELGGEEHGAAEMIDRGEEGDPWLSDEERKEGESAS